MSKRTRMSVAAIVAALAAVMTVGVAAAPADAGRTSSRVGPIGCC